MEMPSRLRNVGEWRRGRYAINGEQRWIKEFVFGRESKRGKKDGGWELVQRDAMVRERGMHRNYRNPYTMHAKRVFSKKRKERGYRGVAVQL